MDVDGDYTAPEDGGRAFFNSFDALLSEDGGRAFFNSFDALVPQDLNCTEYVYECEREGFGN